MLSKNKPLILSLLLFFSTAILYAQPYGYKVFFDIGNGPETARLHDTKNWPIVSKNCDGPWLLTWNLRKNSFYTNPTTGMDNKKALGAAFTNKTSIVELPCHWTWDKNEKPEHEKVSLDCGLPIGGVIVYYEDLGIPTVLFVDGVKVLDPFNPVNIVGHAKYNPQTPQYYPTIKEMVDLHGAHHEVYILAREWVTNEPPRKQFDKSLDACHGVCFEFQVPYKNNTPPKNIWEGVKYAIDNNKKAMMLLPPPNKTNDKESYTYLEGVKQLLADCKANLGDKYLNSPLLIFAPNSYNWDKKHYRTVPETTPDGRIANTAAGAALWLLNQRNPGLYVEPAIRKTALDKSWQTGNIGTDLSQGEAYTFNDTMVIKGGGYDGSAVQQKDDEPFLGTTADKMFYAYKSMSGDCEIVTKVMLPPFSDRWGRCGVMIREDLLENGMFAALFASGGEGTTFQYRNAIAAKSLMGNTANIEIAPIWLKLNRTGSLFTAYKSENGTDWTLIGSTTIQMNKDVLVGIGTSNHARTDASAHGVDLNQYPGYLTNISIVGSRSTSNSKRKGDNK